MCPLATGRLVFAPALAAWPSAHLDLHLPLAAHERTARSCIADRACGAVVVEPIGQYSVELAAIAAPEPADGWSASLTPVPVLPALALATLANIETAKRGDSYRHRNQHD